MGFAHAAGDELGYLRTEVEDEDFVGAGHIGIRGWVGVFFFRWPVAEAT